MSTLNTEINNKKTGILKSCNSTDSRDEKRTDEFENLWNDDLSNLI